MDNEPRFAFEKKLGVAECVYGNVPQIANLIGKLLFCIKETNEFHGVGCEFFRLDFRQPYLDETLQFPTGSLILDLKWGSKKEIDDKKKSEVTNVKNRRT